MFSLEEELHISLDSANLLLLLLLL